MIPEKDFPLLQFDLLLTPQKPTAPKPMSFYIKNIILTICFINYYIITFGAGNLNAISIVDPTTLIIIWDEFRMTAFSLMTHFVTLTSRTELNFYLYHVFSSPFKL